jgi:hypothetical protein
MFGSYNGAAEHVLGILPHSLPGPPPIVAGWKEFPFACSALYEFSKIPYFVSKAVAFYPVALSLEAIFFLLQML